MAPSGLQRFISQSTTNLRIKHIRPKPDSADGQPHETPDTSQRQGRAYSLRLPRVSSGFVGTRFNTSSTKLPEGQSVKKSRDMFDTDAESIGDTTTHSLGNSEGKKAVELENANDKDAREQPSSRLPLAGASYSKIHIDKRMAFQRKAEDNASSLYPDDLIEEDAEYDPKGDPLRHAKPGFPFLNPGETQEWNEFQQRSLSHLDVEPGSEPETENMSIPQRVSSIGYTDDSPLESMLHKLQAQQAEPATTKAQPRQNFPQHLASRDASPLAMREKPLPAAPPPEYPVQAYQDLLKKTPFPLTRISESKSGPQHPSDPEASTTEAEVASGRLDYSPRQLTKMSYAILAKESFDFVPGKAKEIVPEETMSMSLEQKLEYLTDLMDSDDTNQETSYKRIISSFPLDEFEQFGQWIMQQLEENVAKQSTLRRRKRTAAQVFEQELAERMNLIKRHKGHVDRDLRRLKVAGSNMVAGQRIKQGAGTAGGKVYRGKAAQGEKAKAVPGVPKNKGGKAVAAKNKLDR